LRFYIIFWSLAPIVVVVVVIHIYSMDIQLLKFPWSTMIVLTHMMFMNDIFCFHCSWSLVLIQMNPDYLCLDSLLATLQQSHLEMKGLKMQAIHSLVSFFFSKNTTYQSFFKRCNLFYSKSYCRIYGVFFFNLQLINNPHPLSLMIFRKYDNWK